MIYQPTIGERANMGIFLNINVTDPEIGWNLKMLEASDNESARLCAVDARACLAQYEAGAEFPGVGSGSGSLPTTWRESAIRWVEVGAQHAWGWERNRPVGWVTLTSETPVAR